jgi:hypothetical protein
MLRETENKRFPVFPFPYICNGSCIRFDESRLSSLRAAGKESGWQKRHRARFTSALTELKVRSRWTTHQENSHAAQQLQLLLQPLLPPLLLLLLVPAAPALRNQLDGHCDKSRLLNEYGPRGTCSRRHAVGVHATDTRTKRHVGVGRGDTAEDSFAAEEVRQ